MHDAIEHLRRGQRLQRNTHIRPFGDEGRDRLGEIPIGDREGSRDRQRAETAADEVLRQRIDGIDSAEDRVDLGEDRFRFRGRLQPA